ncbi:alpha/beta hydrolase [Streptomyces bambusae]|uniref:RBBP9/YdeN family alpha/beta hydrolase n=1 Tax=Streptomyces bambusae TaxID=1550616 RepID=UPI001CFEEB5A|nr:alpha/beta hydrolase [Streptomyces bambusae]MCB5165394.1 alpha/beta hydrolase [Streptomyces bambusae]
MSAPPHFLVLPGYEGSGPEHWQSRWEAADPAFLRVEQADWDRPALPDWLDALDGALAAAPDGPVVLVAHSLGCVLAVHWAVERAGRAGRTVTGALLVAPPDIENAGVAALDGFCPVPRRPLPFPALVVASSDDPWCPAGRAAEFAAAWGAQLVVAGAHGHLNSASGLGDWPAGRDLLARLHG